jgi:hypothetical protein
MLARYLPPADDHYFRYHITSFTFMTTEIICFLTFFLSLSVQKAPTVSEIASKARRQKAMRSIILICLGAIIFISAVSFSSLPL